MATKPQGEDVPMNSENLPADPDAGAEEIVLRTYPFKNGENPYAPCHPAAEQPPASTPASRPLASRLAAAETEDVSGLLSEEEVDALLEEKYGPADDLSYNNFRRPTDAAVDPDNGSEEIVVGVSPSNAFLQAPTPFAIDLGTSLAGHYKVIIEGEETCTGILVTGAIGTGKTENYLRPMIRSLFANDLPENERPGALILNTKDGYGEYVTALAEEYNQRDRVVVLRAGGDFKMNILSDFPARKLAESFFSAVEADSRGGSNEQFWIQNGIRLLDLEITLLRAAYCAEDVTLDDVRALSQEIANPDLSGHMPKATADLENVFSALRDRIGKLSKDHPDRARLLYELQMLTTEATMWVLMDSRPASSILGEVFRVLYAFQDHSISQTFCARQKNVTFRGVREITDAGKVVVIDCPAARDGLAGKIINVVIRRQLYAQMIATRGTGSRKNHRPVYVVQDEAHGLLTWDSGASSPESCATMASLARSLRLGIVIATQEVSALFAAAGPDRRDVVRNLLRNLRTHIYLQQPASIELQEVAHERSLPYVATMTIPNLERDHAVISRLGVRPEIVRVVPDWQKALMLERFKKDCNQRPPAPLRVPSTSNGDNSPYSRRRSALMEAGHSLCAVSLDREKSRRIILVHDDPSEASDLMDQIEEASIRNSVPIARLDAAQLGKTEPGLELLYSGNYKMQDCEHGIVLVERLEDLPHDYPSWRSFSTFLSKKKQQSGICGMQMSLQSVMIFCTLRTSRRKEIGFRATEENNATVLPTWFPREWAEAFHVRSILAGAPRPLERRQTPEGASL